MIHTKVVPLRLSAVKVHNITDHSMPLPDLYAKYATDPEKGLAESAVPAIREKCGYNELTPPEKEPAWLKFFKICFTGFSLLLWVGSVLCLIVYGVEKANFGDEASDDNMYLGIALAVVTVISSAFTFYEEQKSNRIMESFKKMMPQYSNVRRDGKFKKIEARELVQGDIVHVVKGDKVPADIIIIEASQFKVDNSSLTGESEPITKTNECTHDSMFETANIAFYR